LKPDLAEIWNQKGEVFVRLRQYDDAKGAFNIAIKIKSKIAPAWYNLASLYSIEGKKKKR
jgi:tetratricopeptide (TPR) repeat protein